MKNKLIYYLPAIPYVGIIIMILYDCFNDETEARLCIKNSEHTVECFILQLLFVIAALVFFNIIPV